MKQIEITDLEDPRLAPYRSLRTTNENRHLNLLIAEGTTLVERLFHSDYEVQSVLASSEKLRNFEARVPNGTTVYRMARKLAAELVGYSFHTGVLAAALRKPSPRIQDVVPKAGPALVVYADQVIDQENLGALIRISSAFGANAFVAGPGCADPFSRRVLRVSMGNGLFLPVIECQDPTDTIRQFAEFDFRRYATVLDSDASELSATQYSERSLLIVGNETHGVSKVLQDACDKRLTLSMLNQTDSLNVAVAAGIFAYVYRSQHQQPTAESAIHE